MRSLMRLCLINLDIDMLYRKIQININLSKILLCEIWSESLLGKFLAFCLSSFSTLLSSLV